MSVVSNIKDINHVKKIKYNAFISDFSNQKYFEQKIRVIFNHELKKEFENILLYTKEHFIDSVKEKIFSILTQKYSNKIYNNKHFLTILSKHIQKLANKYEKNYSILIHYYNIFHAEKNKYKTNKNINISKYYFSNHRKHCSYSQNYATHLCNKSKGIKNSGKFIKIQNDKKKIDYLICENCQKVYSSGIFPNYCHHCKKVYFSSELKNEESERKNTNINNNLMPAALKNNHCETITNELLYCPLCNNVLFLNLNNDKIQCINEKCKNYNMFEITENTEWKCKSCTKLFNSDYIIYNPLEIQLLSEEINYALNIKIKAKPNKLPCCKNVDLNSIDFCHSQKCSGLIYIGEYNDKKFIICEECKAINYVEKYIWICPNCKNRFREVKEIEKEKNSFYKIYNNDNGKKFCKNINKELKKNDFKKNNSMERRKIIFSQEYDYDNENDSYFNNNYNFNDENCDLNIITDENYKNKSNIKKDGKSFFLSINKYDFKKSRNNNIRLNAQYFTNNIILTMDKEKSINSIDTNKKGMFKKGSMLYLTSNNFYSEKNKNEKKAKENKLKQLGNIINTNSIIKNDYNKNSCSNKNQKNCSFEKRGKKYLITSSGYNKNKINNKNIFLEKKASSCKRKKNYTPNICKVKRDYLNKEKNEQINKSISKFSINDVKKGKNKMRNKSPFLLRRILNCTLGDSSFNINKNNEIINKNINVKDKNNDLLYKLNLNSSNKKRDKYNRDNSINFINKHISNKQRELLNSSEKRGRINMKEKISLISQRQSQNINNIYLQKEKSKSENKTKERNRTPNETEKHFKYNFKNKYKCKIKSVKKSISLKPKDIIEPSKMDLSKDIPITNEAIKKDKILYQEIQRKLKTVISKGKLPQFFLENYTIIKKLGEGSFGSIFEVVNNETKIKYAIKKIVSNDIPSLEVYQKEFEIVHENKHPNILDIHGICIRCLDTTTYALYVLMDIAEKDWEIEINERAKIKKYYTEKELLFLIKQIVKALYFLQKEKNIAHRDIKPENILLFKNNVYKIADFGEAKQSKNNRFRTLRGTEFYMSPILYKNLKIKNDYVRHNPYKSDVFSLGYCIICAIALNFDIIEQIREKNSLEIKKIFNKWIPKFYSDKFMELIFKMIEENENKRLDFIKLKQILDKEF